jgi:hypothetical protein
MARLPVVLVELLGGINNDRDDVVDLDRPRIRMANREVEFAPTEPTARTLRRGVRQKLASHALVSAPETTVGQSLVGHADYPPRTAPHLLPTRPTAGGVQLRTPAMMKTMRERFYELPAGERDRLIVALRARGWTLARIGARVGMSRQGVAFALERIKRGDPGVDRRG